MPESVKNIKWSIEDESIASVQGDNTEASIHALKTGDTRVIMRFTDSEGTTKEKAVMLKVWDMHITPTPEQDLFTIQGESNWGQITFKYNFVIHTENIGTDEIKKTTFTTNLVSPSEINIIPSFEKNIIKVLIEGKIPWFVHNDLFILFIHNPAIEPLALKFKILK